MIEPRFTNHGDRINWRGQQANAPAGHVVTGPRSNGLALWLCTTCSVEWSNEAHPTGTMARSEGKTDGVARGHAVDDLGWPYDA